MPRILCLWLPNWPIQRLTRSRPELSRQAVVLEAAGPRGSRVAACCAAAAALGIRPEMPLAEAKALLPSLTIEPHDPREDGTALLKLAAACERFSPCVALEEGGEPESLLLDVSNLTHLLGTDTELAERVERFFVDQRYRVQVAVADTVGLAWAVAHYIPAFEPPRKSPVIVAEVGKGEWGVGNAETLSALPIPNSAFAQLPIESLRIVADTAAVLRELGIETVGQLLPLPRAELALRFGDRLLLRLDQFTGAAPEVLVPHREPAALEVGCTLEHPTADRALLVPVLAHLTDELAQHLAARDQGAILLVGSLRCADGQTVLLRIGLVEPTASARRLMELIDLHVETLALTDEVVHVELRAAVIGRLGERQGELFAQPWPSDPHQLALLINRLSSRLGYEQVVRAELRASPLPERAVRYVPMTENCGLGIADCGLKTPNPQSEIRNPKLRPLLLYPEPRPVKVLSVAPDGPPQFVWLEVQREQIVASWGPERVETLWWRGPTVRRDYYRIATESGNQLWLFRRLADGHWFLHGIFA